MLFEPRLREGLCDGSITTAFRRWRRPQVVAGHSYRLGFGAGMVRVLAVAAVEPDTLTAADARAAGFPSVVALLEDVPDSADPLYRITFGALEPDPRDALQQSTDASEFTEIDRRLARLAAERPLATLALIDAQPAVRAADLKDELGWPDLLPFKLHVRKLKALGLTISLETGYRLSPRGAAYLRARTPMPDERPTPRPSASAAPS